MVRKLTAWKTIAVFAKKNSLKKKYIYIYMGYQRATATGNFLMRHFLEEHN